MNKKTLLMLIPVTMLGVGCSSEPKRPMVTTAKPVQPKPIAQKTPPLPPVKPRPTAPGTATYAIEPPKSDFKLEPNTPAFRVDPLAPPVETPIPSPGVPATAPATGSSLLPSQPAVTSSSITTPIAPVATNMPAFATEDAKIPAGTSPAVLALVGESDRSRAGGDLDQAVVSMERALRIDSRNATLTYKLAQLRVKQNKPQLAEELAGKSALLAGSDLDLKRKSWLLIAEARRMQQNYQGAKEAKHKAESFFGR